MQIEGTVQQEVYMKDRLGNELKIGDKCVCHSTMRTGSSTKRLVQYVGEIIKFTPLKIKVKCLECEFHCYIGDELYCYPMYTFKCR